MVKLLNGNQAAAHAARLARIEVCASYPITPASPSMELVTNFIADGSLKANFVRVESDHSAMAACVGSAMTGARTYTISNSQGLAYMSELLHHAAGLRLPIVMAVVNRALSAPHNRFPDHGDAVAQETSGWIQLYTENTQEIVDTIIQAFRIAEDSGVRLPVMVNYEGYIVSHVKEPTELPDQAAVDAFAPVNRMPILDVDNPMAINQASSHEIYMEFKRQQEEAMERALEVIEKVNADYAGRFGRNWGGLVEGYRDESAEVLVVTMGSIASVARDAVDGMREAGIPVGLLKIRSFRPFPTARLIEKTRGKKRLVVIDRNIAFGSGGALAREVRNSLYDLEDRPGVSAFIAGLGGRDVVAEDVTAMVQNSRDVLTASYGSWYGVSV